MQISTTNALAQLIKSKAPFLEIFKYDQLSVEIYKPVSKDLQQPHTRDEVYVIIDGQGTFYLNGAITAFSKGDFIFVPAHAEHRFETFSDDFSTWVLFFGEEKTDYKSSK
jgi:mannose-6-phosphate isomerase-like protein (cupin superfamily)